MANVTPTQTRVEGYSDLDGWSASWVMAQGDVGVRTVFGGFADRTMQIEGIFGGASVALEGSNDGVNFHALTDPQGNVVSLVAAGIKQVTETTMFFRPRIVGGDGTTALVISAFFRKTHTP